MVKFSSLQDLVIGSTVVHEAEIDYSWIFANEELLQKAWVNQDKDFWLKFMVTLRSIIILDSNKNHYNPIEYDKIFISVLKKLTMKSFTGVDELLNNLSYLVGCKSYLPDLDTFAENQETSKREHARKAGKEIFADILGINISKMSRNQAYQCYKLHVLCAGTIINALKYLTTDEEIEILSWQVPSLWFYPSPHLYPFESFLKDNWGERLFCVLNIKKEQIGWWDSLVKLVKLPKNDSNPLNFSPNLGWLPKRHHREVSSVLPIFRESANIHNMYNWNLLLLSFPPLMARKFHIASAEAIDAWNSHDMSVGSWFVVVQEALGTPFMDLINHMHNRLIALAHQAFQLRQLETQLNIEMGGVKEWSLKMKQMQDVTNVIREHNAAPKQPGDGVENSAEFLLEPSVLIQIPWNPVIQRQWLAAAIAEVLKFELETIEFRHWAVPTEVEECVRELLSLIRQAKEGLLLGLYLFCKHTTAYPNTYSKIPTKFMDQVVIPATAILELLCSGQAYRILYHLKNVTFTKSCPLTSSTLSVLKWMPEAAYLPHKDLLEFYCKHYWHILHWQNMAEDPLPSFSLQASVTQMWHNEVTPCASQPKLLVSDFNQEEKNSFDILLEKELNKDGTKMITTMLETTIQTIKILVKNGYFPKSSEGILLDFFKGPSAKKEAAEVIKGVRSHSNIKQAMMSSILYKKLQTPLNGIHKADALQGWMLRLSGEIIEREQLARLAAVCGMLLKQSPVLPGCEAAATDVDIEPLLQVLKDTRSQRGARTRDWLWQQLPSDWQSPVLKDVQAPCLYKKMQETDADSSPRSEEVPLREAVLETVAALQARLGSLIAAIAKASFQMWESGHEAYPDWSTLQYIVPGHLSALVAVAQISDTEHNRARLEKLITLLHTMIASYERNYFTWLDDAPYREEDEPKMDYDENEITLANIGRNHNRCISLTAKVSQLMHAFVGLGKNAEGIPGHAARTATLVLFQMHFVPNTDWDVCSALEKFFADAWEKITHGYYKNMLEFCLEAWKLPVPGVVLPHKHLGQLYFANAVLEKLAIEMADLLIPIMGPREPAREIDEMCLVCPCSSENMRSWRSDLLARVVEVAGLVPKHTFKSEEDLDRFSIAGQDVLNKMWGMFYRSVQRIGKFPKQINCLPTDSPAICKAMDLFVAGCLDELGDFLELKSPGGHKASQTLRNKVKKFQKSDIAKSSSKSSTAKKTTAFELQHCRACKTKETKSGEFTKCPECVKEKYPDVNYFCSEDCKDNWWKEEHMAEHLEFSLGLSHLCSHPNAKKN